MAHYAILDENNIVIGVFPGKNEDDRVNGADMDWEAHYSSEIGHTCKRTSYNTIGNVHTGGGTPYRKNYAGIGYIYDPIKDAFYGQQPFPSWTLNNDTCLWEPPTPHPTDSVVPITWDEATLSWIPTA